MDPSDPDAPASQARKRAKPPVIELEATDVTPEAPKPERGAAEAPRQESKDSRGNGNSRASSADGPSHSALPILSGLIGLLAGALVLALVFLFVRGGSLAEIAGRASRRRSRYRHDRRARRSAPEDRRRAGEAARRGRKPARSAARRSRAARGPRRGHGEFALGSAQARRAGRGEKRRRARSGERSHHGA